MHISIFGLSWTQNPTNFGFVSGWKGIVECQLKNSNCSRATL